MGDRRANRSDERGAGTDRVLGYSPDAVARDAAAVFGVAVFLIAVHFVVPESVASELAFRHSRPETTALLTAAYVHASDAHLFGNLAGYLTGCVMAYVLCLQTGHRRWFHRTFAALVVLLPVLVNLVNYAAFAVALPEIEPVSRGFSGVTAGFGGFVFVAFLGYLAARFDRSTALLASQTVLSGLLAEVYLIYAGRISAPVWASLGVGATALAAWGAHGRGWRVPRTRTDLSRTVDAAIPAVLVVVVLGYFVYALFPADVVDDGRIVNVFAHAVGFVLGGALATVTRVLGASRAGSGDRDG